MPTIALRFPGGRYHATSWGSHVNEGDVEWPPSPWRVLRALLAVGFTKLGWTTVPDDAAALVRSLAVETPSFRLPPGTVAQSRHYMPVPSGRRETTTKVIDGFIRLDPSDELLIHYPTALPERLEALLASLVTSLGYLGRAESWATARLADTPPGVDWCSPVKDTTFALPERGGDQVAVLAPVPAEVYATWREVSVRQAISRTTETTGRAPTMAQRAGIEARYPADLLACLLMETAEIQKHGWSQPPGSHRVLYARPAGTLERRPPPPSGRGDSAAPVEAALLALASDAPRGGVLPLFTRCLPQAELLHQSLVSLLGEDAPQSTVLSGRDPKTGKPLGDAHRHAHYLPLDLDGDGRLDHVIVHAPMRFDALAQRAIRRIRRTWTKGEEHDIIVTCAGWGSLADFAAQLRSRSGRPVAALAFSKRWVSVTPFVPPRHLRPRGHTLEDQVRAEIRSRGLPQPRDVAVLPREELTERKLLRFVRVRRSGKPQPPAPIVFGLRLVFDEAVPGPIALGYASHYGLGLFEAEPS